MTVNHKKVYRLYREEQLQVARRRKKWFPDRPRQPLLVPESRNQRWSMDFVSDRLESGRAFRMLNIVDDFTRECAAIEVDLSLTGERVVRVLDRLAGERGLPKEIVLDYGPEFASRSLAPMEP